MNAFLLVCIPIAGCGATDPSFEPYPDPESPAEPDDPTPPTPPPGPSLRIYDYHQAVDITPDGSTALFGDLSSFENKLWFVDTVTGTAENRTNVGNPLRTFATGIAQTGEVTALHGEPVTAGVWTAADGWKHLETPHDAWCDEDIAAAWDISANGQVVVGMTWNGCSVEAFRSDGDGLMRLEVLGERIGAGTGQPDNRATVVSDDGTTVAGFAMTAVVDRAPAIWAADGSGKLLPREFEDAPGEVLAINRDGTVLAGLEGNDGFVWTRATGTIPLTRFDLALPSDPVFPNAMTADGAVVFGGQGSAFFGTPEAFLWSEAGGLRKISDLVTAAGLAIPAGVVLMNVTGASSDGTVLIGTARNVDTNADQVFVVRLPASAIH